MWPPRYEHVSTFDSITSFYQKRRSSDFTHEDPFSTVEELLSLWKQKYEAFVGLKLGLESIFKDESGGYNWKCTFQGLKFKKSYDFVLFCFEIYPVFFNPSLAGPLTSLWPQFNMAKYRRMQWKTHQSPSKRNKPFLKPQVKKITIKNFSLFLSLSLSNTQQKHLHPLGRENDFHSSTSKVFIYIMTYTLPVPFFQLFVLYSPVLKFRFTSISHEMRYYGKWDVQTNQQHSYGDFTGCWK